MSKEDQKRYERQKKEKAEVGFFIMDDGRRSCDVLAKKKRTEGSKSKMVSKSVQTVKVQEAKKSLKKGKVNRRPSLQS